MVTPTCGPTPPAAPTDALAGLMEPRQPASWLTVNVWPAIVNVPVRAAPVFAAALIVTMPLPMPVGLSVTESQPTLVAAVQEQAESASTATVLVPPPVGTLVTVGWIVYAHGAPGACCVTANV